MHPLLGEHFLDLLVAQSYLVDRVTLSLEGFEVALDIGGEEDLWTEVSNGSQQYIECSGNIPGFQSKP